ncbi:hypothetical protein like AT5G22390 [Hibiscus trionum]|uniref:FAF domain-containing protein n=1 Tax=Hibiscus trionum TaxID=183268 RepID=A0A9W7IHY9_HIBTR|nr:hypothetical protein like AT5G22390 [Hibiscus trionum]
MAACGSIQRMFEKPLPENPTLLESLSSWNQIKPIEQPAAVTEIFGELHFKENICIPHSSSFPIFPPFVTSSSHGNDENDSTSPTGTGTIDCQRKRESFTLNAESLQLCTEGLGFESSDEVEDMRNDEMKQEWTRTKNSASETENLILNRSREFPPPISCIGKSGKPCVCFKSYRQDGRFVLKRVRVPTQEFLHACREDGRLKLQFLHPNYDDQESGEEDSIDEQGI